MKVVFSGYGLKTIWSDSYC